MSSPSAVVAVAAASSAVSSTLRQQLRRAHAVAGCVVRRPPPGEGRTITSAASRTTALLSTTSSAAYAVAAASRPAVAVAVAAAAPPASHLPFPPFPPPSPFVVPSGRRRSFADAITTHRRHFSTNGGGQDDAAAASVVVVSIDEARVTTAKALEKIGWDASDAALQAEIMVAAELCGNNQGLVKMYQPAMMAPAFGSGKPVLERETSNSAVVNANQAPGMLAAVTAADKAVDLLEKDPTGGAISIVSSYNSSTSSGQLAFYVERMARRGYIGLAVANSPELVAAAPGGSPVFGTNPLAVGVPTSSTGTATPPFTFDMATSAIALFGVLTAKAQGLPLPHGVAYDRDGNVTTDAAVPLDGGGSLATFGGHKGAGLSLCVELLAGVLSGGAVLGMGPSKKDAKSWGHTFIAIRPGMLVDDYEAKVTAVLDAVRASGPGIRIPGERSAKTAAERTAAGEMPIPTKIWESIVRTAEFGLPTNPSG